MSDDIDAVVALGRKAHALSAHATWEFDDQSAAMLLAKLRWMKDGVVWISEHDRQITGLLLGHITTPEFVKVRIATDIAFYAERPGDGKQLLRAFEQWAKDRKADEILIGVSFGGRKSDRYYERAGYTTVGGVYIKGVRQ